MVIVNLKGGLGNQMFEYAAGRSLAVKLHDELKLDTVSLLDRNPVQNKIFRDFDLDIFPNINAGIATKEEVQRLKSNSGLFSKLYFTRKLQSRTRYFKEKKFSYQREFEQLDGNVYLDGYWQSEKYFKNIEDIIRNDFTLLPFSIPKNLALSQELAEMHSVCINVRRGDFVNNPNSSKHHGFVGLEYILASVHRLSQTVHEPNFYVFSDDISWCKENIRLDFPMVFVDHSHAGHKFSEYLHLMSLCHHFVIPNSSFAWWAAWLCQRPGKIVITPKKWFNEGPQDTSDLIPSDWIRL